MSCTEIRHDAKSQICDNALLLCLMFRRLALRVYHCIWRFPDEVSSLGYLVCLGSFYLNNFLSVLQSYNVVSCASTDVLGYHFTLNV